MLSTALELIAPPPSKSTVPIFFLFEKAPGPLGSSVALRSSPITSPIQFFLLFRSIKDLKICKVCSKVKISSYCDSKTRGIIFSLLLHHSSCLLKIPKLRTFAGPGCVVSILALYEFCGINPGVIHIVWYQSKGQTIVDNKSIFTTKH